jgi:branched-chain amino acid transport system ATP-binding protein
MADPAAGGSLGEAHLIETRKLSIQFGGHVAVDRVDLQVTPYRLKSIIGPNGAGKTTLFNLISGQYKPTSGQVFFHGQDITHLGPAARTRLGLGRSFQLTNIFPSLSVLENVRLALQSKARVGLVFWRHYRTYSELEDRAYELLGQVLMQHRWADEANTLTHGEQRKLEIAILLALDPEVLLLDEPTAGMSLEEVPAILEIIKAIKAGRNRTILLVEHKFDMIMALSDSIAVLKEGALICDDTPESVAANREVQEAYLGGGVRHD